MKNFEELMTGISERREMPSEAVEQPKEINETGETKDCVVDTTEKTENHERSKDCIVLNFRLLINQNAKKRHCRHSRFSQMQNVNLPFSMLHHAPGYGIIGARSSAQKPLR